MFFSPSAQIQKSVVFGDLIVEFLDQFASHRRRLLGKIVKKTDTKKLLWNVVRVLANLGQVLFLTRTKRGLKNSKQKLVILRFNTCTALLRSYVENNFYQNYFHFSICTRIFCFS
jgi:hypothetical protein